MRTDLEKIFSDLKVPVSASNTANSTWVKSTMQSGKNAMQGVQQGQSNATPDVSGMGMKDAVYMLESKGYVVIVHGKGKVSSQSIPKGTPVIKGKQIILILN
jgi:cell division protein FtsI (penicillin-binding protein 3)